MINLKMDERHGLNVPVDPQDPEVLRCINGVRDRMGWESLPAVPVSDPTDTCACVFGSTWGVSMEPTIGARDPEYDKVIIACPSLTMAEAINDVINDGSEIVEADRLDMVDHSDRISASWYVRVPGEHPLMRWMWQFDHSTDYAGRSSWWQEAFASISNRMNGNKQVESLDWRDFEDTEERLSRADTFTYPEPVA